MCMWYFSFFFFFFQAEDGIRDHCVTGVQTCALPISVASIFLIGFVVLLIAPRSPGVVICIPDPGEPVRKLDIIAVVPVIEQWRSEERRVGKECRYRWTTNNSQKKESIR